MNENKKIEPTERMVEDALRAAREQGWDDAAEWGYRSANLGHYASERIKAVNPHRPVQELPTKDGAVIVPAGGGPIGAAHPGGKFTTRHATYDSYLGRWVGVWRAASGRVTVSSVSPGDITPGTWKVEGE